MIKTDILTLKLTTSSGSVYEIVPEDGSSNPIWLVKKDNNYLGALLCFGILKNFSGVRLFGRRNVENYTARNYIDAVQGNLSEIIKVSARNSGAILDRQIIFVSIKEFKRFKSIYKEITDRNLAASGKSALTNELLKHLGYSTPISSVNT